MPNSIQLFRGRDESWKGKGGPVVSRDYYEPSSITVRPLEGTIFHSSSRANLYDPGFLHYCQTCVNKRVHVGDQYPLWDMPDTKEDGCCGKCGRCIMTIPAASLSCWIVLAIGISAFGGALYVAAGRTRVWLEKTDTFLPHVETVSMAVLGGMMFFGTLFLFVSTLVSNPTNRSVFNTSKKNTCGRVLNIIILLLILLFDMAWVGCTVVLAVPVMYFVLFHILYKDMAIESINLKNYALSSTDKIYQGNSLDSFYSEGKDVFICYIIALAGSFLVVLSLTCFLLCAAANYVYMKEARYSVLNPYRKEINTSKTSIIDTRM